MFQLRRRPRAGCAHHWHVSARGWECCACPGRTSRNTAPPEPAPGAVCRQADRNIELIGAWLAPARPLLGSRPGRRGGRATPPTRRRFAR